MSKLCSVNLYPPRLFFSVYFSALTYFFCINSFWLFKCKLFFLSILGFFTLSLFFICLFWAEISLSQNFEYELLQLIKEVWTTCAVENEYFLVFKSYLYCIQLLGFITSTFSLHIAHPKSVPLYVIINSLYPLLFLM